jgi:hypothetical protein
MRAIGSRQHRRPRRHALLGQSVMHVVGRQQSKTAVMVLGVVPREEDVAVGADVLDRAEPFRERRPVLQRLELRLRERLSLETWGRL